VVIFTLQLSQVLWPEVDVNCLKHRLQYLVILSSATAFLKTGAMASFTASVVLSTALVLLRYLFLAASYNKNISIQHFPHSLNDIIYSASVACFVCCCWDELSTTCGAVSGYRKFSSVVVVVAHVRLLIGKYIK